MSTATLDPLTAMEQLNADSAGDYRHMVFDLAANLPVAAERIRSVLALVSRSLDDLRRHVQQARSRKQATEQFAELSRQKETDLPAMRQQLAAAHERLKEAKAKVEVIIDVARRPAQDLERRVHDLSTDINYGQLECLRTLKATARFNGHPGSSGLTRAAEDRDGLLSRQASDVQYLLTTLASQVRKNQPDTIAGRIKALEFQISALQPGHPSREKAEADLCEARETLARATELQQRLAAEQEHLRELERKREENALSMFDWREMDLF